MPKRIIPPDLAITSMRSSGYRDTAYAIAELVDNSIEARANRVEILCRDTVDEGGARRSRRLDQIAVYDNGDGMDPALLEAALTFGGGSHQGQKNPVGMGKFGMGLPNSSISQCKRLDVWTWQGGTTYHTYLDVGEIERGITEEVPEPREADFPDDWRPFLSEQPGESGSLVVWSKLDRVRWRTSRALLENSQVLIGRIYRYFLKQGKVRIRAAAFAPDEASDAWDTTYERLIKPNDPLYLMSGTSTPAPYDYEPAFEQFGEPVKIDVHFREEVHPVTVTFSLAKTTARELGGESPLGQHARYNIGISLIRADRELDMSQAFVIGYDPRERWWGAEVCFPPALDEVFGVSNNKQSAHAFAALDLDEDAAVAEMSKTDYLETLRRESDVRAAMYEIAARIQANLKPLRAQIRERARRRRVRGVDTPVDPAETAATRATDARRQDGHEGQSDRQEGAPAEERTAQIVAEMVSTGVPEDEARDIAVEHVESQIKYIFQEASYEGASFFSVASRGGAIIVYINLKHPAAESLYEVIKEQEAGASNKALEGLKLLLCAWARMEDETTNPKQLTWLQDRREDWGRIARDFLREAAQRG
ncbi:MAG: histidine kinase, gyrase and HSP90-like ATPase family protein [Gemmatimonadetes bacterium]|nr:histidine kinase, gyrase and HSP90-like ATPase family protein [Gemmatimonadota bacterium]